jgi:hypothetical protein
MASAATPITIAAASIVQIDRSDNQHRLRCTFNLSRSQAPFRPSGKRLFGTGKCTNETLGAYAALIEELE